jgi:hypothetical protein
VTFAIGDRVRIADKYIEDYGQPILRLARARRAATVKGLPENGMHKDRVFVQFDTLSRRHTNHNFRHWLPAYILEKI